MSPSLGCAESRWTAGPLPHHTASLGPTRAAGSLRSEAVPSSCPPSTALTGATTESHALPGALGGGPSLPVTPPWVSAPETGGRRSAVLSDVRIRVEVIRNELQAAAEGRPRPGLRLSCSCRSRGARLFPSRDVGPWSLLTSITFWSSLYRRDSSVRGHGDVFPPRSAGGLCGLGSHRPPGCPGQRARSDSRLGPVPGKSLSGAGTVLLSPSRWLCLDPKPCFCSAV